MSYQISELNGIKIYNLSSGKTTPQFLEEAQKKKVSLRYNTQFRNRIELIQDFDFPVSCSQVSVSQDQQYIIATGIYSPSIKIYQTSELSMKCMRGLDAEVIKFCILSDDYSKIAMANHDRSIEFHAQYGRHYKLRVPHFPRDMVYNPFTCDLSVASASNEIYRISLEEGKFLPPFEGLASENNCLDYNGYLNLLYSGGSEGIMAIWDYRQRQKAQEIVLMDNTQITAIKMEDQSMGLAVGGENGLVKVYDIRFMQRPTLELQHQYQKPIKKIQFHEKTKNIISCDKKIIKIYNKETGKIFTNIQTKTDINNFELVKDSGLFLIANEDQRIGTYFVPSLDTAPKWCPFLENITEELEEDNSQTIYDEFKFLSQEDLEKIQATHLIGSKMLKKYMHGFVMHKKLYQKLKSVADPFEYMKYQKEQADKKFEEQRQNRITLKNKIKPKINQEFQDQLKDDTLMQDSRFNQMFSDPSYVIDKKSDFFKKQNPSQYNQQNKKKLEYIEEDDDVKDIKKQIQKKQTETFENQIKKVKRF